MAKPTNKRRGINLEPRADTAAPLDKMTFHSAEFPATAPTATPGAAAPAEASELLTELRRMSGDLETRWQHQEKQFQKQLEQQQNQIVKQTRQLGSLEQARRSTARIGVLLSILALVGVSALGFRAWPGLQELAGNLTRVNSGVSGIAPELQAIRGQLTYLESGMGQMRGTIASLRAEVTGLHTELGSLRKAVDSAPSEQGAEAADTGPTHQVAHTLGREPNATSARFQRMHPMRPW